jgi:hypothetical protein
MGKLMLPLLMLLAALTTHTHDDAHDRTFLRRMKVMPRFLE